MKEIKFTTRHEPVLSFSDKNFKEKYEEKVGNNLGYAQILNGELKHFAVCPRCDNPVVILGIYKKIDTAPHARHAKGVNIPGVTQFDEYKFLHCPYHKKKADYIKEYVPETEEPQRRELYKAAREHFDKAIYLLQKEIGIYLNLSMVEKLAENYALTRAYNYIDATIYNIPWYLIYSYSGFPLHHMLVRKDTTLHKHLLQLGFSLKKGNVDGYEYVEDKEGHLLIATNYRYVVDKEDNLKEWLDFSIVRPDPTVTDTLLYIPIDRFSVRIDSNYFSNLIEYKDWKQRKSVLEIAAKYMEPY